MLPLRVLLVGLEPRLSIPVSEKLRQDGHEVVTARRGLGMEGTLAEGVDLVVADGDALVSDNSADVLHSFVPKTATVLLSDQTQTSLQEAAEGRENGAIHFPRGVDPAVLAESVRQLAEKRALDLANQWLYERLSDYYGLDGIVGTSKVLKKILAKVEKAAGTGEPVLITGEPGTGKKLLASAIHLSGMWRLRPLVLVSASEFAGLRLPFLEEPQVVPGNGFHGRKKDVEELARGGTLLVNEVAVLRPAGQKRLLRLLEYVERNQENLGERRIRVIATTRHNLWDAVSRGHFGEELYFRLSVSPIHIPPLRERREDIPILVEHFISSFSNDMQKPVFGVSAEVMRVFVSYSWPGNVRELRNVIEGAVLRCSSRRIEIADLPEHLLQPGERDAAFLHLHSLALREAEATLIKIALEKTGWNLSRAANLLGISRGTLYSKMDRYGLRPSNGRHFRRVGAAAAKAAATTA